MKDYTLYIYRHNISHRIFIDREMPEGDAINDPFQTKNTTDYKRLQEIYGTIK